MATALIAISIAALGAAVVRLILDDLDDFTGDVALDQAYEGGEPVENLA
jgi:hypothetical protein